MATTRKLADLFRAIASQNMGDALAIAEEICAAEERGGHQSAARLLRGSLHSNGKYVGQPSTHGELKSPYEQRILPAAIVALSTDAKLADVVLRDKVRKEVQEVILEWKNRERLRRRGIPARTKLLFYGPPGCGKSLTARSLGQELGIPVYLVRFDAVIGAYLGQTAIHLRQLFHFAETTSCILLLDELDALGKRRGNPLDVGELDRIVIALMQELEHSRPRGLIIGTSNLPKNLDDALWRRFDLVLPFDVPSKRTLTSFARRIALTRDMSLSASVMQQAISARTFAGAESVVIGEARRQALRNVRGHV
jgi:SpoVK/Ycf46/Vps4 family AAA+-type ATPase